AELEGAAVVGVGPGAAGAVEALLLVEPGQRERRATHPHLLPRHLQRVVDPGYAGGVRLAVADLEVGLTGVLPRCVLGHAPLLPAGGDAPSFPGGVPRLDTPALAGQREPHAGPAPLT